jgi:hypothetical protein
MATGANPTSDPKAVAEQFFLAMHTWEDMKFLELFQEDGVYIEPFSGTIKTHHGRKAIGDSFRTNWKQKPPNFRIEMGSIEVSGTNVRAEWNCTWDGLGGWMRGTDDFEIRNGKIARLEVRVSEVPGSLQPR